MTTPSETVPSAGGLILLADDDAEAREGLGALLSRLGYECVTAPDAEQAKLRLGERPYDALLADIHMPGNTALELVESLVGSGVPVVLLTGRPSFETAVRAVGLPIVAYLTKPPEIPELVRALDRAVLQGRGLRMVRDGRERLREWEGELARLETQLSDPAATAASGATMENYLRVSLRQAIRMLTELERATQTLDASGSIRLRQVDHVAALRHTVEVIERTRRSFKSKELADLRRQIEWLLDGPTSEVEAR